MKETSRRNRMDICMIIACLIFALTGIYALFGNIHLQPLIPPLAITITAIALILTGILGALAAIRDIRKRNRATS